MRLICAKCGRVLEFSGERPSFCAYCGHALTDSALGPTGAYDPAATRPTPADAAEPGPVPEVLGGYRLGRSLGAGGMGTVYEAEEVASGRQVALKLIAGEHAESPDAVERFRQEGRLAGMVAHPRCVFVLAVDEDAGRPYIVMERMPGATLEDLVRQHGPLPPEEAVAKVLDVIEGLQEAHRLDVIHRDVKPSNCFLEPDGRVKVGDFGLAKSLTGSARLTRTGSFLGTPHFASPEQIRSEPIDQQTDVYSVAATLFYLLTGRPPFGGDDTAATLARIVSDPTPSPRRLQPELPAALDRVVQRGLERDRRRRWHDLEELRQALLPFVPAQLSIGSMGLRLGAYLIDGLLYRLVVQVVAALVLLPVRDQQAELLVRAVWVDVLGLVAWVLYFVILEGVYGCSLGKRLLRLRVCRAASNEPPGLLRATLRTGLFVILTSLGESIAKVWQFAYFSSRDFTEPSEFDAQLVTIGVLPLVWLAAGILLLVSTMRARNGYRGLHEVLSGTRVLQLPWPGRRRTLAVTGGWLINLLRGRRQGPDQQSAWLPEQVGGFAIRGALRWDAEEKVLLGEDAALGRKVLIGLHPVGAALVAPARRAVGRPTRLRWVGHGRHREFQWDAFLAPSGCPLPELVAEEELSWPDVRPMLEQLADELTAACADGTLPGSLDIDQVWVRPDGRVQLSDTALTDPAGPGLPVGGTAQERALALLRQVAATALEGRPRKPDEPPVPIRVSVPEHARQILDRLMAVGQPYSEVRQLQADLAATQDRPVEVNRALRAGQLAVTVTLLSLEWAILLLAALLLVYLIRGWSVPPAVAFVLVFLPMIVATAALEVLGAALFRGGLAFRVMGIGVARVNGRPASRLRCAWRTFVAWALVLAGSFGLALLASTLWRPELTGIAVLALLGLCVVVALLFPRRSPHDLLAGTCLVPR